MEQLHIGVDAAGRAEARLRVRFGKAPLEVHLRQDGAGGVEVALHGAVDGDALTRVATALAQRGCAVTVDERPAGAGTGSGGGRERDDPRRQSPRRKDRRRPSRTAGVPALPRRPGVGVDYQR